jgi:HAD superfamily hydrolase (TIGR01450 family)
MTLHFHFCLAILRPLPLTSSVYSIDGVLLRSSGIVAGAAEALACLHRNKIPFILLTNGGGKHESTRVEELTKKLGVPLTEENFVQSHTPFKQLVDGSPTLKSLKDQTILVTGGDGDKCRRVAEM